MSGFDDPTGDAPATRLSAPRDTLAERALAFAGVGAWEMDLRDGRMRWTRALAAMCERDAGRFDPGADAIAPYCDPTSGAALRAALQRARKGGEGWDLVIELAGAAGRPLRARCRGEARREAGQIVSILGVVVPIGVPSGEAPGLGERERLALIQARQRMQLAADVAGVGFWERDLRTGIASWDKLTYAIYGVDPGAGPPAIEDVRQLVHPDDRAAVREAWERLLVTTEPVELEFRVVQPSGHLKTCLVRALSLREPGGAAVQVLGAIIDLTQQRETQLQLAKYDAWLRMASSAAGIGLFLHSPLGGSRVNDRQMLRLYGFDPDGRPPTNEDFVDRVLPEDRAAMLLARHRAAQTDEVVEAEYRVLHPQLGVRHVLTRRQRQLDADGRVTSIVGAALDVTELRQSEIALRSAHETLKLATRTAGIGIWVRSVATGAEVWNRRLFAIHGVRREDFAPGYGAWLRFVHPDDRERIRALMERARTELDSGEAEFRIVRDDGAERVLTTRFVVERDRRGNRRRVLGTVKDITDQRAQERERNALLERLQLSARTARIGYWERRADRDVEFWDASMRALYELGDDVQPDRETWLAHVHPEDRDRVVAALARQDEREDQEMALEYRIVRRDGSVLDVADRYRVERDAQGRVVRRFGVHLDITDIRSAQRQRDEIAQQLHLAGTALDLGVWVWDPVRHRSVWNEQMYRLFGHDRAWFETRTWIDAVHPDDAAGAKGALERVAREGGPFSAEFRAVHADGAVRWLSSRGFGERNAAGTVYRVIGINVDITERREVEERLLDLNARLQLATRAAGLAVWQMEPPRGGSLTADELFVRLHGLEPATGRALWTAVRAAVHPDDLPRVDAAAREAAQTGELMAAQYRVVLPNGAIRHLALRGQYRYDDAGAPTSLQGVVFDTTERVLTESAVRERDMAERANRAKTEFLSRVSHELRTPLNAILGFAQVMELDPDDRPTSRQRERIGRISEAGWHLLALIDELVDLGRIEAGMPQLAFSAFSLDEVLDECAALVAADAERREVRIQRQRRAGAPPAVRADRRRVKQVVLNLLSNAIKYNRQGGSILVTLDRESDGLAALAVRDTGIGLTAHQIDRLFQPFNRLGREATPIEGTGIGLAISRQLVEQMGGRLTVASEPAVGSVFTVTLPAASLADLAAESAEPTTRPRTPATVGLRRQDVAGTVLYVEDDAQNTELVEQLLLLRPNVQLLKAPDGATGRVLAAACQPDLALIDLRLPDMTGEEFFASLRQDAPTRAIPCIAVTADAVTERAGALRAAGFAGIWTKPIQASTLLAEVDRRLAGARPRSS